MSDQGGVSVGDRAAAVLAEMERHESRGRLSGMTGIASFCSCGLAYYAESVADADNRLRVHQHTALGAPPPTSWFVAD